MADLAFYRAGLLSVTVPQGARLGNEVFKACPRLEEITLETENVGNFIFAACPELVRATLREDLPVLPGGLFQQCGNFTTLNAEEPGTVNLPATLIRLWGAVFLGTGIQRIDMSGLTHVEDLQTGIFHTCRELTSITLPPNLKRILGDGVFGACENLESLTIPPGVTEIGAQTFAYCSRLQNLYVEAETPPAIVKGKGNEDTFRHMSALLTIHVPSASLAAYRTAWQGVVAPEKFVAID